MNISESVQTIVDILEEFSHGELKEARALAMLLQHAHDCGRTDAVGALAFHGEALTRLLRTIRTQPAGGEHVPQLEQEFSRTLEEFRGTLETLVHDAPDELSGFAARHYLPVTEHALVHLLTAAGDFAWLKRWELAVTEGPQEG